MKKETAAAQSERKKNFLQVDWVRGLCKRENDVMIIVVAGWNTAMSQPPFPQIFMWRGNSKFGAKKRIPSQETTTTKQRRSNKSYLKTFPIKSMICWIICRLYFSLNKKTHRHAVCQNFHLSTKLRSVKKRDLVHEHYYKQRHCSKRKKKVLTSFFLQL